ncbi:MAG: mechanosensitive ion channel [Weeksellaceae bacterium]|nr:mechanosensitive ion channel [Weeksellaceae bacterium]
MDKGIIEILEYELFTIGKYTLNVYAIVGSLVVITVGLYLRNFIRRLIYRSHKLDLGKKFAFSQIVNYLIILVIFFLVMNNLGVNISPLLLGSGAILVGIGLGLQNLFLDFISGIIILVDRTIQVGDVVDIEGTIGEVEKIKMRTTQIRTRENKNIIFPNSALTKNKLVNFSLNDDRVRFQIPLGVHYDSDMAVVEKSLIEAAIEQPMVLDEPKPFIWIEGFGDSAIEVGLYYFSRDLFAAPRLRSDIRKAIVQKFRENGVEFPYPHTVVEMPENWRPSKEDELQRKPETL